MSTYYKKHELSLSLNGDTIMHIARNASGVVVFRETSEKALKGAIDDSIKEQYQRNELVAQKKAEKEKKKQEPEVQVIQEVVEEEVPTEKEVLIPTPKRVTRGPDGKFISKSQLDADEDLKKKTFWDKLTG